MSVQRPSQPELTFGPPEAPDPCDPVHQCDKAPELPLPIKLILNRNFPGWSFPLVSENTCYGVKESGGLEASAHLIQGDFNDDRRLDYAVLSNKAPKLLKPLTDEPTDPYWSISSRSSASHTTVTKCTMSLLTPATASS